MAFFNKFKIGSTSYDVQDANAGKALDVTASKNLELLDADGGTISSVQIKVNDLGDTLINNPTDGQVLTYDAQDDVWKNAPGGGGGGDVCYTYYLCIESSGDYYTETFSFLNPHGQTPYYLIDDPFHPGTPLNPTLFYQYITGGNVNIQDQTGIVAQVYAFDNTTQTFGFFFDNSNVTYKVTFQWNGSAWECTSKGSLMTQ